MSEMELDLAGDEVTVHVDREASAEPLACPEYGQPCPGYDRRTRRWRHLDTCQFRTILAADLPRVE